MKRLLPILTGILLSVSALAQDFKHGDVSSAELDMKNYDKDTSAHAVFLNEYGDSHIAFDNDYRVKMTFKYHARIKFFDSKEFENHGTFEVHVYSGDGQAYEEVQDVKGTTYFKDDNGNLQKEDLDPKKVFTTSDTKHWSTVKFAMPGLRKGCVIEVSYSVVSPYLFNFHSWDFQDDIPKASSTYEVHIPGFWYYNAMLKGYLKLTRNTSTLEKACMTYGTSTMGNTGISADCSHIVYGMDNIPAFVEEDYMTSPKNYISGITFELAEETDINTGAKRKITKDWKDIDKTLKDDFSFGSQLKRASLFKDRIATVAADKADQLAKAKAIYYYINHNIKWNELNNYWSNDGIKQALDKHTGNAGDINLALVTALNTGGIPADAVLLSTRSHGALTKLYPNLDNFNYVVARATIGDKSYLLDGTDPMLPFGMLPMRCLNDQGRAFSLDKPSDWVDLNTSQRETTTYNFDLTLQADGKLKGTIKRYSVGYDAYLKRKEIKKFNSIDEYVEHVEQGLGKAKILKSDIVNLDSLEMPVEESYEVEMNLFNNMNHDKLMFNPVLMDQVKTNPFKLAQRDYPVDWGMPSDERFIITIHVPDQYTIENPPQNLSFGLPNQGGRFLTDYQSEGNTFTFSYVTQFNKSIYTVEEYPYLKELYNKIILVEKNEMVFKKKG
ncbi:MAG TPA: transglutaminase domain-containing protein [Mucilaginibacter sp.]|nr:transglutaminase domain-containing protein [Mucilaginibacter sp.]